MTPLPPKLTERIEDEAAKQKIYEPKYGGKDHSGYETMMKYEINYEREEAGEQVATTIAQELYAHIEELRGALEYYGGEENYRTFINMSIPGNPKQIHVINHDRGLRARGALIKSKEDWGDSESKRT